MVVTTGFLMLLVSAGIVLFVNSCKDTINPTLSTTLAISLLACLYIGGAVLTVGIAAMIYEALTLPS